MESGRRLYPLFFAISESPNEPIRLEIALAEHRLQVERAFLAELVPVFAQEDVGGVAATGLH